MMLKRVAVLSLIVTATTCWAQIVGDNVPAGLGQINVPVDEIAGVIPRTPLPKRPVIKRPAGESRLAIKFRDDLKFRPNPKGDSAVVSLAGADTTAIEELAAQFQVQFVPSINWPQERLTALQNRAALHSGKAQPDLGGMMYVVGPEENLEAAAIALHASELTEYVYFQVPFLPGGGGGTGACCVPTGEDGVPPLTVNCVAGVEEDVCETVGGIFQGVGTTCPDPDCADLGACCITEQECVPLTEDQCVGLGGSFKGIGTNCILDDVNCQNEGCGDPANGSCFEIHVNPFCDEEECCDAVGDLDPFCVNEDFGQWDQTCVWIANLICEPGVGADRCAAGPLGGNCFEVHPNPGCSDEGCCAAICLLEPFCCEDFWDENCVILAEENCINPNGTGPTPDFVPNQGYLRPMGYANQPSDPAPPSGLASPAPDANGFTGEGYFLTDESLLEDDPDALTGTARFRGLFGLGRELHEVYGIGDENRARGEGIKVAVIEWTWFAPEPFEDQNGNGDFDSGEPFIDYNHDGDRDHGHEDLDVKNEPGQTLILVDDVSGPSSPGQAAAAHATACLGIINAKQNGFGISGIAPDAKAYFFPLTSVEEGPRESAAFAACYETLGPGDIVSCSFGPPPGNLNNVEEIWTLIRLGSDLGITTCVAAGNSCFKLDDLPSGNLGDSGAIVVGACTPGEDYCRLTFSNHFENLEEGAWGQPLRSRRGMGFRRCHNRWLPACTLVPQSELEPLIHERLRRHQRCMPASCSLVSSLFLRLGSAVLRHHPVANPAAQHRFNRLGSMRGAESRKPSWLG